MTAAVVWPIATGLLGLVVVLVLRFIHTEAEETRELVRGALVLFACPLRAPCPGCKVSVAYHATQVQQAEGPLGASFGWVTCPNCKSRVPAEGASSEVAS